MSLYRNMLRLKQANAGLAAVEFALILPVMLLIFFGITEVSRYILFQQKLQKAAADLSDIVTQNNQVSKSMLDSYADALEQIMQPFGFKGSVIYSSIAAVNQASPLNPPLSSSSSGPMQKMGGLTKGGTPPITTGGGTGRVNVSGGINNNANCKVGCVVWQYQKTISSGSQASKIGSKNQVATLPNDYQVESEADIHNVFVVELYGEFTPMLGISQNFISWMTSGTAYAVFMNKPREQGTLLNAPI